MRKNIIIGNWKMNKVQNEVISFIKNVDAKIPASIDAGVAVPSIYLLDAVTASNNLIIAAQNVHFENTGAFTGEISPVMLNDTKVGYAVLGHSERRQYFAETNETVNKKMHASLTHGIIPIICVGETIEEFEAGITKDVIRTQIEKGFKGIGESNIKNIVIAYEPVWAIGTGKVATNEIANDVCGFIRKEIERLYSSSAANAVRIQYGGSVTPDTIDELLKEEHIDGALVGGASLEETKFLALLGVK